MLTPEKPVHCEWHEVQHTQEGLRLQAKYSLSNKAAALIDGLWVASLLDASQYALSGLMTDHAASNREALAIYLSELESMVADNNDLSKD